MCNRRLSLLPHSTVECSTVDHGSHLNDMIITVGLLQQDLPLSSRSEV